MIYHMSSSSQKNTCNTSSVSINDFAEFFRTRHEFNPLYPHHVRTIFREVSDEVVEILCKSPKMPFLQWKKEYLDDYQHCLRVILGVHEIREIKTCDRTGSLINIDSLKDVCLVPFRSTISSFVSKEDYKRYLGVRHIYHVSLKKQDESFVDYFGDLKPVELAVINDLIRMAGGSDESFSCKVVGGSFLQDQETELMFLDSLQLPKNIMEPGIDFDPVTLGYAMILVENICESVVTGSRNPVLFVRDHRKIEYLVLAALFKKIQEYPFLWNCLDHSLRKDISKDVNEIRTMIFLHRVGFDVGDSYFCHPFASGLDHRECPNCYAAIGCGRPFGDCETMEADVEEAYYDMIARLNQSEEFMTVFKRDYPDKLWALDAEQARARFVIRR